jgi:hypothetical protein
MLSGLGETELELEGLGELEGEFESEFEGESEFELEGEGELEFETEFESEGPNPVNRVYPDAMMEHMGLAAMEAETEAEAAEHFLPLIPLVASKLLPLAAKALPRIASKVLPRVAKVITRATPSLTRGVTAIAKTLHRNPQTRPLVRVIPSVARRAVATLAKRAAAGHPVTPRHAVRILAHENRRVLRNPQIRHAVLRRAGMMDRKAHQLQGFKHIPVRHGAGRVHGVGHAYGQHGSGPGRGHPYGPRNVYAPGRAYGSVPGYARAGVCPTCGTTTRQGVRRVCCCC